MAGKIRQWLARLLVGPRHERTEEPVSSGIFASFLRLEAALTRLGIRHALIGGFALAAHRVTRGTADVDFLIDAEQEPDVHAYMVSEHFEVLLRTENVSNYLRAPAERVDFLHAKRSYTHEMLTVAEQIPLGEQIVRVVKIEDLIGLKVQSSSNDPRRHAHDMADIRSLMEIKNNPIDLPRVRTYFALFGREAELDELLHSISTSP